MSEIMNLETEPEKYIIVIDGESFEFASPETFEFKEFMWMQSVGQKFDRISKKEYSESGGIELEKMLNKITRKILPDISDEIFGKLKDMQKIAIIKKFNLLSSEQAGGEADVEKPDEDDIRPMP